MKLIFIGAQGSGKGTQAKIIAKKLGLCHISTGDLLRQVEGELKKEVEFYVNQGTLVPNELILKILKKKLEGVDCELGFILDGYPRNLEQAKTLDEITSIDKVIEIFISDGESVKRVLGRALCKSCNINYNLITEPKPKNSERCDICNGILTRRLDDTEDSLKKRLEIYHKDTEPILNHYDSIRIDGERPIQEVTEEILNSLNVQAK